MSDTIRTLAALLNLLRDGQAQGAITPQTVRDLLKSLDLGRSAVVNPLDAPYLATGGTGQADDTTAVQAAQVVAAASAIPADITLPFANDFKVTAVTNVEGARYVGKGRLLKAITGGTQQLNSYADLYQHVFGREYLSCFHNRILAGSTNNVVLTGDSTTLGTGASGNFVPDVLLKKISQLKGAYFQVFVNRGQSGKHSGDWQTTYLAGDLTAAAGSTAPHLMIVRWGINDPFYSRTATQYIASMRSCLATIRASYTLSQMSILLMAPNSTDDTPNGRDEKWYEAVIPALRQMARDYNCCFYDTYARFQDSRHGIAGSYMDDIGGGISVHPVNVLNALIYADVADILWPSGHAPVASNAFTNLGSLDRSSGLLTTALPTTFNYGVTIDRADTAVDALWPFNGAVMTLRQRDGTYALQMNWSFNNSLTTLSYRVGQSSTWYAWSRLGGNDSTALTLLNSWVAFDVSYTIKAYRSGDIVRLEGLIKSGTTTSLTIITQLPVGFRPARQHNWFACATDTNGQVARIYVDESNGQVVIHYTPSNGYLSLDGISFLAA